MITKFLLSELWLYQPIKIEEVGKKHPITPIKVYFLQGKYIVADGNHRVFEAGLKNIRDIEIEIQNRPQAEALILPLCKKFSIWFNEQNETYSKKMSKNTVQK